MSAEKLLHQAQRGLFNATPKHGIFATITYKPTFDADEEHIKQQIMQHVRDVIKQARKSEAGSSTVVVKIQELLLHSILIVGRAGFRTTRNTQN